MNKMESKNFSSPSEVRKFEKGKVELVEVAGRVIGKATFEPGWKWSEHVKPLAGTDSCQAGHFGYQLSGVLRVKMDDGSTSDFKAGDVSSVPPGHDAWVVGSEPVVAIDWQGMVDYASGKH